MGVVSWDEAIEADNLHYINRGLDVLLPLAGALREFNNTVAGRELLFFDNDDDPSITALTDFLNKFVRFPRGFIDGLAGAEFCSQPAFELSFGSWYREVYAGFKFEDAERAIASAFGLAQVTKLSALLGEQDSRIDFHPADQSTNPNAVVVLRAKLKTAARNEPLAIPLFRDVERFKPIDEAPLLSAVANLLPSRVAPTANDRTTTQILDAANSEVAWWSKALLVGDHDTNKLVRFDPTGCQHWGPVEHQENWLPIEECFEWNGEQHLFRHPSGHWTLLVSKSHCEAPSRFDQVSVTRYDDAGAADWLFDNDFDIPSDMLHFVQERFYRPDEVTVSTWAETSDKPSWKSETGELWFRGKVVRKVSPSATTVIPILDVFQEDDWPQRVDAPFTSDEAGKEKRRDAIRTLNRGLLPVIRFGSDGSGEGIVWRIERVNDPNSESSGNDVPF